MLKGEQRVALFNPPPNPVSTVPSSLGREGMGAGGGGVGGRRLLYSILCGKAIDSCPASHPEPSKSQIGLKIECSWALWKKIFSPPKHSLGKPFLSMQSYFICHLELVQAKRRFYSHSPCFFSSRLHSQFTEGKKRQAPPASNSRSNLTSHLLLRTRGKFTCYVFMTCLFLE